MQEWIIEKQATFGTRHLTKTNKSKDIIQHRRLKILATQTLPKNVDESSYSCRV